MAGPRNLVRATLHTLFSTVLGQGASIASGIAIAHAFGPTGRGTLSFATILLTFAFTTAEGIRGAVAFQIGKEGRDAPSVWAVALRLIAALAPIGVLVFALVWRDAAFAGPYLYVAIAFPFALYAQTVGIIYLLRERSETFNVRSVATFGGGGALVMLAGVTLFHASLPTILTIWVASYAVAAVWSTVGVRELLGPQRKREAFGPLLREQFVFAAKAAMANNVTFFALRVDVFIVNALSSPVSLGIYTLALATGEIMWGLSKSFYWSATGRVAMLPFAEAAALTARIVRLISLAQIAAGVVLFVAGPALITFVYGTRFEASGGILRVLLPGIVFYGADGMLSFFIASRAGRPGLLLAFESLTLVLCGCIALAAFPRLGIAGAALANTISYVVAYAAKMTAFSRLSGIPLAEALRPRYDDLPLAVRQRAGALFAR